MTYTKEELKLIWVDSFYGLEYKHKRAIFDVIKNAEDSKVALENAKSKIVECIGENEYNTLIQSLTSRYMNYCLDGLERRGITAITYLSENYPERLKNIEIFPLILYAKGDISLMDDNNIAMVGSRKTLPVSIALAKKFARELSKNDFILVTGIAEGVDSAVLEGALEESGKVISVIAGGFDHVYPSQNTELLDRVMEKGLALAEFPPEVKPQRFMFPVRNRIIAGLARGTLVVSGRKKSGTLYTAEYAEEFGRDLFAIPYSVGIESGEGCNDLIKRGAILCDSVSDILDFYGVEKREEKIDLTPDEQKVIGTLREGSMHIEKIADKIGKQVFEVQTILSVLEIKGVVVRSGANVYGLIVGGVNATNNS